MNDKEKRVIAAARAVKIAHDAVHTLNASGDDYYDFVCKEHDLWNELGLSLADLDREEQQDANMCKCGHKISDHHEFCGFVPCRFKNCKCTEFRLKQNQ